MAYIERTLTQVNAVQTPAMPTYDARAMTDGGDLARLVLDDQIYMLRITRAGKLILTK